MLWSKDKCEHILKYDGTNVSLSGIGGPDEFSFKVGDFQIKKEVLQAACDIAQMYDMFAYRNCERIKQFPKDSSEKTTFILEISKNEERLIEFLAMLKIAIVRPSEAIEKALADWIALSFTKRLADEAPIIPEKVRAGDIVREIPPVEEYNKLKRNIAKAKIAFPYLKDAFLKPQFNIEQVYRLNH